MTSRATARDLDIVRAAYLRHKMEHHLQEAEEAVTAYRKVDDRLADRYPAPEVLRDRRRDSLALADAAALLSFHRPMACMYAAVLTAELACQAAQDHPIAAGEAVRPAPAAASPAASESPGGAAYTAGAGVQLRPPAASRTREPNGNGVRPGVGQPAGGAR